jgi:hypothetical protein
MKNSLLKHAKTLKQFLRKWLDARKIDRYNKITGDALIFNEIIGTDNEK